jgi:uncharacterized membrane protein
LIAYASFVAFSVFGTIAERRFGIDPGLIKPVASFLTLCCGFMAIFTPIASSLGWRSTAIVTAGVFFVGAASEILGIYAGLPFGVYSYTANWQPVVLLPGERWFPLLLPVAWTMIVGGAYLTVALLLPGNNRTSRLLGTALLAVVVDAVMEPVMVNHLQYWTWRDSGPIFGIPLSNAFGWFIVSLLAALALEAAKTYKVRTANAPLVLVMHLMLMGVLALLGNLVST